MIVKHCADCNLVLGRIHIVNGEGNTNANIMLIGESPGHSEDKYGTPFIGRAGKYLRSVLKEVNIDINDCYLTNVIKCKPPRNRLPTNFEIGRCYNHLVKEIVTVKPTIIITLGSTATKVIFQNMNIRIGDVRGRRYNNTECNYIFSTYHPSAALKDKSYRKLFKEDMKEISKVYKSIKYR